MSAFLCSTEHIGHLATLAATLGDACHSFNAYDVAGQWAEWNLRSVAERYHAGNVDAAAGDCGFRNAAAYVDACQTASLRDLPTDLDPRRDKLRACVSCIKLAQCLEYQSCEFDAWKETKAYDLCQRAIGFAMSSLPGWQDAPWGYRGAA